jgi:hypothetical protein
LNAGSSNCTTSDAECFELSRFFVQRRGESVGEGGAIAIMLIRNGVGDGHRARQSELELVLRVGARGARFELVHGPLAADRASHGRDLGLVAVGADTDRLPTVEVDALEIAEKAMDEMDARLLAVADDVDAGVLLALHREDGRVDLARRERVALEPPCGPKFFRFSKPEGLRQAAGDGGFEHVGSREAIRAEPVRRGDLVRETER